MCSTVERLKALVLAEECGRGVAFVVVGGHELASELKRRRIGRSMVDRCDRCAGTAWLPGDPSTVPASLLVLAAMSLTRR